MQQMKKASKIRKTDAEARATARDLLDAASFAALGSLHPETGHPQVTRVALVRLPEFGLISLISDLSDHSRALRADPRCSLLVGEPSPKGDPLNHPRITLSCHASFLALPKEKHSQLRALYLDKQPKAKLYVDFGDFHFIRFTVLFAALNGGFGKAYHLDAGDLGTV